MKTITTLLAATFLVAGAATAMADQQRSDEAVDYSLSLQAAHGSGGGYAYAAAPRAHRGPYASARHENGPREQNFRAGHDFGNDPNVIQFQEQGSY